MIRARSLGWLAADACACRRRGRMDLESRHDSVTAMSRRKPTGGFIGSPRICVPVKRAKSTSGRKRMRESLPTLIRYYNDNAGRMRCDEYLRLGYGIGNGAVESAHKQVVHARFRQAGIRWSWRCACCCSTTTGRYWTGCAWFRRLSFSPCRRIDHRLATAPSSEDGPPHPDGGFS